MAVTKPGGAARTQHFGVVVIVLFIGTLWLSDASLYPVDSQSAIDVTKPFGAELSALAAATAIISTFFIPVADWSRFLRNNFFLLALCAYSFVSCLWSVEPFASLKETLQLVVFAIFCAFAQYASSRSFALQAVYAACASVLVVSLFLIYAAPEYGVMSGIHAGLPRGAFSHKNNFGEFLFGFLAVSLLYLVNRKRRALGSVLAIVAVAYLFLAHSSTALSLLFLFVATMLLLQFVRHLTRNIYVQFLIVLLVSTAVTFAAMSLLSPLLDVLGRDVTFSGRTSIWSFYWDLAQQAPWVGHGAYAVSVDPALAHYASEALFLGARSPHNGYVETAYNLGNVGLALLLLYLASLLLGAFREAATTGDIHHRATVALILCVIAYTAVESYQSGLNPGLMLFLTYLFRNASTGDAAQQEAVPEAPKLRR